MRVAIVITWVLALCASAHAAPDRQIAALVAQLDRVGGSLGTVGSDPIAKQLIAIGDPAVDALIAAIGSDARPSAVRFDREREYDPVVAVSVSMVAYYIAREIVGTRFFDSSARYLQLVQGDRAAVAGDLRAHWAAMRKLATRPERWFAMLADDHASVDDWVFAAEHLAGPTNPGYAPERGLPVRDGIRGEVLRARAAPSVNELLVQRITAMPPATFDEGCSLTEMLVRWDQAAALPVVKAQLARGIALAGTTHDHHVCLASLAELFAALGDPSGIDEYATWLAGTRAPTYDITGELAPLGAHADRPAVQRAADTLFGPQSPWAPLFDLANAPNSRIQVWLGQPLLGLVALRRHASAALADHRVAARILGDAPRRYVISHGDWSNGADVTAGDPDLSLPLDQPMRVSDFYAHELARQPGAPRFELYWPLRKRDAAIAQAIAWLATLARP